MYTWSFLYFWGSQSSGKDSQCPSFCNLCHLKLACSGDTFCLSTKWFTCHINYQYNIINYQSGTEMYKQNCFSTLNSRRPLHLMMTPVCPRLLNLNNDFVLLRFWARAPEDLSAIEVIYIIIIIIIQKRYRHYHNYDIWQTVQRCIVNNNSEAIATK